MVRPTNSELIDTYVWIRTACKAQGIHAGLIVTEVINGELIGAFKVSAEGLDAIIYITNVHANMRGLRRKKTYFHLAPPRADDIVEREHLVMFRDPAMAALTALTGGLGEVA